MEIQYASALLSSHANYNFKVVKTEKHHKSMKVFPGMIVQLNMVSSIDTTYTLETHFIALVAS